MSSALQSTKKASLSPLVVHPLPAAPSFIGREAELKALSQFWQAGPGVLSLIGLGGAGKTALAERFLSSMVESDRPDGVLVWSFYDDPDANQFLKTAHQYFAGGDVKASGAGWFHLLSEALGSGGRYLLVLDGLERVQRQQTDASGIYGELEDPLLRGLLARLAAGAGETKAIITSRFPVASIERWQNRGYSVIDVDQLSQDAARALLRSHGVEGTPDVLDALIADYGGHALTLDLLAGALASFYHGDASTAPAAEVDPRSANAQSARLARVLRLFEDRLPETQLDLLSRLCVFRFGVDLPTLKGIFLGQHKEHVAGSLASVNDDMLAEDLDDLVSRRLAGKDGHDRYTIHPAIRDHFYRRFRDPSVVHQAVREHLVPLSHRPGIGLPTDKESLDLLEELVYHAIQAGSNREAAEIFVGRMGGGEHLNTNLGEYTRTFRILSAFPESPDPTAMYHCLRAFGRFDEALRWRPNNRYILLLCGRLKELSTDKSEATSSAAKFLRGDDVRVPDRMPDSPVPAAFLRLYDDKELEAERIALIEIEKTTYMDDLVRNELVLVEIERRRGALKQASVRLERASQWVLNSGSQEHLCLLHMMRSRLASSEGSPEAGLSAVEEGVLTARECGFDLWLVDLLLDRSRLQVRLGRQEEAVADANEALAIAERSGFHHGINASKAILTEIGPASV